LYIHRFWLRRGFVREGLGWLEQAICQPEAVPARVLADVLNVAGVFMCEVGNLHAAEVVSLRSLELWRREGDSLKAAVVENNLARIAFNRRDLPTAKSRFGMCAKAFEEHGDVPKLATSLENLGIVETQLCEFDAARDHLECAVALQRMLGNRSGLAKCLASLLGMYEREGSARVHLDLLLEAAELTESWENPALSLVLLNAAAGIATELGMFETGAQLIGCLNRVRDDTGIEEPFAESEFREEVAGRIKRELGLAKMRAEHRKGSTATPRALLQQAIARMQDS
jgi:tetratricopeptide (TPR) repeat protein